MASEAATPADEPPVLVEDRGPVRWIWLNRPRVHNAQNLDMLEALCAALDDLERSESVRVLVLGGKGKSFSAGHDLRQSADNPRYRSNQSTAERRWRQEWQMFVQPVERVRRLPIPTICRAQGHCLAAGMMFVEACDFVVATPDSVFGSPILGPLEINDAEVPTFVRNVGVRRAKSLLWLNERLGAQEALEAGLVNWVVEHDQLDKHVEATADRLLQVSRETLELSKLSFQFLAARQGWDDFDRYHFMTHQLSHHTSPAQALYDQRLNNPSGRGGSSGKDA
ncbi:enoyl-CoA hydratase-related protein [Pseudofrankia sp. DC12]|uniref:enoyl-CoA hydratase-related protein n=1 Tax=Pseudofrankia sp. DC12 TaxID=683315 RepID=UPI0005F888E2|nr:enoyl-CoA hydratase-related protein [Pseudofrankia sp. DC12]